MVQLKSFRYFNDEFITTDKILRENERDTPIHNEPRRSSDSGTSNELSSGDEIQQTSFQLGEEATADDVPDSSARATPARGGDPPAEDWPPERHLRLAKSPHAPMKSGRPRPASSQMMGGDSPRSVHSGRPASPQPGAAHFEIRWRQLSLAARRSKLPRFVAENSLYKLAAGAFGKADAAKGQEPQMCYSPPIGNKRFLTLNSPLPPTRSASGRSKVAASGALETPFSANLTDEAPLPAGELSLGLSNEEYRPILSNLSGSVFSGQLTAILGPSGVGKTSLLNSLTGRNTLTGSGKVQLIGATNLKRMSVVTVPQADVLPEKLTALEDLEFTSRLKNTARGFDHQANIKRIVSLLQMEKFLNTRIEKLSGGEARRLSIGRELLNSPDIMILDEPTSGLDANTCKKIIQALRDIVEHSDNILGRPMSIIVTIHQPQQEVLNLFHRVYVMAVGGCAIYEGPPCDLLPYLLEQSSLGRVTPLEQLNGNPAIVAIEVASGEFGPHIIVELAARHEGQALAQWAVESPMGTPLVTRTPLSVSPRIEPARPRPASATPLGSPLVSRQHKLAPDQADRLSAVTTVSYASTYDAELPEPPGRLKVDKRLRRSVIMKGDLLSHSVTLMSRCWLLTTRDMFLMSIRIIGFLSVAAGIVQIFSQALDGEEHQCPSYQTEPDDILSFMGEAKGRLLGIKRMISQGTSTHLFFFNLILCIIMVTSALTGLMFPFQMRMFVREYKNGWYSPLAFVLSSTLAELPIDMIGPMLSLLITYPLCHQPESSYHWRELCYMVVTVTACLICKSQAQIVGALMMNSVEMSVFLSCVMVTPPALLSGIAVRVSQMSTPLQWISYGSFLRYTFESLFVLRYGQGICPCNPELVHGYPQTPSTELVPSNLNRFAAGILALDNSTLDASLEINGTDTGQQSGGDNLFVQFMRLITDAGNLNVANLKQLGDCDHFTSLFLLDQGVEDGVLFKWLAVLLIMFLVSRIITYFVVKCSIK